MLLNKYYLSHVDDTVIAPKATSWLGLTKEIDYFRSHVKSTENRQEKAAPSRKAVT